MARILLVEDNELNRDMLSRRLIKRGYEILIATHAEQALEMAASEQLDLILMDIGLPGIDGWEATQRLKANPQSARIPVIALTAHALSADRERAFAVGCDDYETKPVDLANLLMKIERALHRGNGGAPGSE